MSLRVVFLGHDKSELLYFDSTGIPSISENQILGKILLSTICGSDVHTLSGLRKEAAPSVLGHEGVIEVLECRRKDCECKAGDIVTFSIIDNCGQCQRCLSNVPQKCTKLSKYGHLRLEEKSGWTGCYASHIVLEPKTQVFKVHREVPLSAIAPINCALSTMVNAVSNIPKRPATEVLIQGAGLLGVYGSALLAENENVKTVYCSDVVDRRLDIVSKFGAVPIKNTPDLEDCSLDVIIEVCGHAAVLREGYRCLKPGGLYVMVGLVHPDSKLPFTAEDLIRKCLTVVGVHNYTPTDLQKSVEFMTKFHKKYPFTELVSPPFALQNASAAFELAAKQLYHRVAMTHFPEDS